MPRLCSSSSAHLRSGLKAGVFLFALAPVSPSPARTLVVSSAPVSTSVTVYREGDGADEPLNLRWLRGYALISETRRVSLPAGDATVRFDGVADGMIAVSAVVSGLPGGVDEKNRDARLLSPASLLDGSLGNRVHLRRTSRATGKVTETEAIIRSGPDNAVVLETPEGIEALRCSGLPETILYDQVPDGLSDKPSFSVQTRNAQATEAEVTLTYLATGFDWRTSYVATLAKDGRSLDLFAWLTVANGNGAAYDQARLLAVAGRPNRTSDFDALASAGPQPVLNLSCWPMDGTSTRPLPSSPPPPPPPPLAAPMAIEVTAARSMDNKAAFAVMAQQEDLGDLKLYRVPVRVDIMPNAQKQVAMIHRAAVPFIRLYAGTLQPWQESSIGQQRPLAVILRMQNREKDGLGVPLPSGAVAVMQRRDEEDLLLADAAMADRAVGEKVEIGAGFAEQVRLEQVALEGSEEEKRFRLTVYNALAHRAPVEILVPAMDGYDLIAPAGLTAKDGGRLWSFAAPANGQLSLTVRYRRQ